MGSFSEDKHRCWVATAKNIDVGTLLVFLSFSFSDGVLGGGRGHDRRRPQLPPPLPWLIVMFLATPRSISMEPFVGSVTHDPINVRHRLEWARMAHRQKKEPKPLKPIVLPWFRVTNFCFFVFLAEALKKNTVCQVVKKRSHQIAK